jgi:hypothetical protein
VGGIGTLIRQSVPLFQAGRSVGSNPLTRPVIYHLHISLSNCQPVLMLKVAMGGNSMIPGSRLPTMTVLFDNLFSGTKPVQ